MDAGIAGCAGVRGRLRSAADCRYLAACMLEWSVVVEYECLLM